MSEVTYSRTEALRYRAGEALSGFRNGPAVAAAIATSMAVGRPRELTFESWRGTRITVPNVAEARAPVFEVFAQDAYLLDDLTEGLAEDFRVLDIGAHVGGFSLAIAELHPRARITCFEAAPATVAYTRRNVAQNRLDDRVDVVASAVSDHNGTLQFAQIGPAIGLNGVTAPAGTPTVDVPCMTLAEALHLAGGADLVKIDAEGAEWDIVLPSDPADWAGVSRVVLEYHPVNGHTFAELEAFFATAGLHVRHIGGHIGDRGVAWLRRG